MFVAMQRVSLSPAYAAEFEERFRNRPHRVDSFPGFIRNEVLRPTQAGQPYIALTHWQSRAGFDAWEADRVNHTRKNPLPAEAYLGSHLETYQAEVQVQGRFQPGMVAVLERGGANAESQFSRFTAQLTQQPVTQQPVTQQPIMQQSDCLHAELLRPLEPEATFGRLTYWASQEDFAAWAEQALTSTNDLEVYQVILSSDFEGEQHHHTEAPRPAAPTVLAKTSAGRSLLFDYKRGEGLPPHTHAGQTVVVAVLLGQLQLRVDDQLQVLKAGEVTTVQSQGFFSSLALQDGTRALITLLEG